MRQDFSSNLFLPVENFNTLLLLMTYFTNDQIHVEKVYFNPTSHRDLTTTFLSWEGSGVALSGFAKENLSVGAGNRHWPFGFMVTYLCRGCFGDITPVNEVTSVPRTDNNASHWPSYWCCSEGWTPWKNVKHPGNPHGALLGLTELH